MKTALKKLRRLGTATWERPDGRRQEATLEFGKFPARLRKAGGEHVLQYSVNLLCTDNQSVPDLCGSGTLVTLTGRTWILTADHVVEFVCQHKTLKIGPSVGPPSPIPTKGLNVVRPFRRACDEWGPDIALIEVPAIIAASCKPDRE